MAIEEKELSSTNEKQSSTESHTHAEPDVITLPYRPKFADSAFWKVVLSPSRIAFVSAIAMAALVAFSLGVTSMTTPSTASSSATSSKSMDMGSSQSTPAANVPDATQQYGDQLATYTVDSDGAKHFTFTAQQVMWEIVKGHRELAWTINGTVPGPMIRVTAGDHIRVTFVNHFPTATAVHWHGLTVPEAQDGVPGLGQKPIQSGETFVYDFTVQDQDVGTHWYHSHYNDATQVPGGFYGAFVVDPRPGSAQAKQAIHADVEYDQFISTMPGGYYTINGKSFPDTQPWMLKHGQTVHVRLYGADAMMMHPMHLHGHTFTIVAEDGHMLDQPIQKDTVQVAPGETYDIVFQASAAPGSIYPFHCHILSHLMNPGQSEDQMGGLITLVEYAK